MPAADVKAVKTAAAVARSAATEVRVAAPGWRPARFMEGQPVHHATFGEGRVVYVDRDNGRWFCEVHFPDAGRLTFTDDDPVLMPGC